MAGPPDGAHQPSRACRSDDYTAEQAAVRRRQFVREQHRRGLRHVGSFSLDPATLPGNIENFAGVAQVPIGLAGPLRINGEHAQGDFYIPMATTEGTLVASYNRGMRLLSDCRRGARDGGRRPDAAGAGVRVRQRAGGPASSGAWVVEHHQPTSPPAAEATTRVGKLVEIEQYAVGPLRYLRFDYTTGDAAGQNMVGRATLAGCEWIVANHPASPRFMLSGGDRHGQEALRRSTCCAPGASGSSPRRRSPHALLQSVMGVEPKTLFRGRQISMTGSFLAGSANNGAHAANGLAALFIATGQDAANIAESHASHRPTPSCLDNGDYYWSITLPALIVATVGGGTGLATQRECLEMLGCFGPGKVRKLAEICAAVVLAGEISLSSAVLAGDWVSSHERLGRNRG